MTKLMYHLELQVKYRRVVLDEEVDELLKEMCLGLEQRYEVKILEIVTDKDHVHFLNQSAPAYSVTAREVFKRCPLVKKKL